MTRLAILQTIRIMIYYEYQGLELLSATSGLDILATILAVPYFGPAD